MLFNSLDFLFFFPIVLIVFWAIPGKLRQVWLLACSYFFYMCWEPKYILLILFSTIITYSCPLIMEKMQSNLAKKLVIGICISLNLLLLFYYKYFNFMLSTISTISHRSFSPLNIILPVGISFFTFQALGYSIDCYRGTVKPERNFIQYALFVSFFPQLVAGPIERSGNLLGQLEQLKHTSRKELINIEKIREGFILMAWGMFLKTVIADRIAILVDTVYDNVSIYGSIALILAFLGFGLQIYCDFCSYSTIAIGAARIMNINLMENFNAPYFSTSITDFWRRWHISLSSWFRDYLYIPLGGSRKGFGRKLLNLMIVFSCSGLWHGANWTFVFWGALHGCALVIENIAKPYLNKIESYFEVNKKNFGFVLCRAVIVTAFVDLAWVFFRADSFGQAFTFIKRMFTKGDWWNLFNDTIFTYGLNTLEYSILAISLLLLFVVDYVRTRKNMAIDKWLISEFAGFRIIFLTIIIFMTIAFGLYGPGFDSQQFIYFQF